jgi:hypothetical protein
MHEKGNEKIKQKKHQKTKPVEGRTEEKSTEIPNIRMC